MRIVFLGPPGAGKGSLASLCETRLGIAHLSPGNIFRHEIARRSSLGRRVSRFVASGRLVPDSLVVEVMAARLSRALLSRGFILDGFPRTTAQASGLDRVLARECRALDGAISLAAPRALLIWRLSGRRVCERCGANYHLRTMRPQRAGQCDRCGGRLMTRKDDEPQTIAKRLRIDAQAAKPLLAYYRQRNMLSRLNGAGTLETVFDRSVKLFHRNGWLY